MKARGIVASLLPIVAAFSIASCDLIYMALQLPVAAEDVPANIQLSGTFDLTVGYTYDAWDMDAQSLGANAAAGYWYKVIVGPRVETSYDKIWGSNPYTGDSSVAFAAVHAGAISNDGGTFYIKTLGPGASFYGSLSHGITSVDYGEWGTSFVVYKE